jgi:hypothetical protein
VSARWQRWLLPAAALLLSVLVASYYLMGTPQYSLYRLAVAAHGHDPGSAERFVDVERIAQAASETIAADYLEHEPRAGQVLEALGQGSARTTAARALKPLVAQRVRAEIARIAREGGAAGALVLSAGLVAAFWRVQVLAEPPDSGITYTDPGHGPTRFRMSQQPDRSSRITESDRDWVRRYLRQPVPRLPDPTSARALPRPPAPGRWAAR